MFSKAFAIASLVLASSLQVHAHAAVSPVLGVGNAPQRSDVKRPNNLQPCGRNVDIAGTVDSSTPAQAAADGTVTMTATNFNRLLDGSRKFTAKVDTTATGSSMTGEVTMVQNGDAAPPELGSQQVVAQLPAGTTCTGGQSGNLCLMQFRSLSGFGNCVVVQQSNATSSNSTAAAAAASTDAAASAASTDTSAASLSTTDTAVSAASTDTIAASSSTDTAAASTATDGGAASTAASATGAAGAGAATGAKGLLSKLFQRDNVGGTRVARRFIEALDLLDAREFDDTDIMDVVGRDMWDLLMDLE